MTPTVHLRFVKRVLDDDKEIKVLQQWHVWDEAHSDLEDIIGDRDYGLWKDVELAGYG